MAKTTEISYSAEIKIASRDYSRLHGRWYASETVQIEKGDDVDEQHRMLRERVQKRVDRDVLEKGPDIDPELFPEGYKGPEP